jgi:hypothetical protein
MEEVQEFDKAVLDCVDHADGAALTLRCFAALCRVAKLFRAGLCGVCVDGGPNSPRVRP